MRKLVLLSLFLVFSLSADILLPKQKSNRSNDELAPYQWGLENLGHILTRRTDDLHLEEVLGMKGVDIGLPQGKLNFKKDVIVALIDSGVNITHPDLKDNIYVNTVECEIEEDLIEFQFGDIVDRDNNGYPGDCMGWNFTGKDIGSHIVNDKNGHGTLMAGVISSVNNNRIGLAGISSRIKILPLKVVSDHEERSQKPFFERVKKAIRYAIDKKADVINMSFGWPLSIHDNEIEQLIAEALSKDVSVVAAMGNDSHNALIYPCHIEGVLCVAAHGVRGELSPFTNYGSGVDIAAPGDDILSTYPWVKDPTYFETYKGYDMQSGSSQSAAYVSAVMAAIKGIMGVGHKEAYARLLLGSKELSENDYGAYISGGRVHLESSLKQKKQALVRPVFKAERAVVIDRTTRQGNFYLTIKNYWQDARDVSVRLHSTTKGVPLDKTIKQAVLAGDHSIEIKLPIEVASLDVDQIFSYQVNVSVNGADKLFKDEVLMVTKAPTNHQLSFQGLTEKNVAELATVSDPYFYKNSTEYYFVNNTDTGLELILYKVGANNKDKLDVVTKTFPGLSIQNNLKELYVVDVNGDGVEDYLLRAIANLDDEPTLVEVVLDRSLNYLFTEEKSVWYWESEHLKKVKKGQESKLQKLFLSYTKEVAWIHYKSPDFASLRVPVIMEEAMMPEAERRMRALDAEDLSAQDRFYAFVPHLIDGKIILKTQSLFSKPEIKVAQKKLGYRWEDQMLAAKILPQKKAEIKAGKASLFFKGSNAHHAKLFKMKLSSINQELKLQATPVEFFSKVRSPRFKYELNRDRPLSTIFEFFTQPYDGRWHYFSADKITSARFEHMDQHDNLVSLSTIHERDDGYQVMFESKKNLLLQNFDQQGQFQSSSKKPIYRSSFLPGSFFTEMFYPLMSDDQEAHVMYYVDSSSIRSQSVYFHKIINDEVLTPLSSTLRVPDDCVTYRPVFFNSTRYVSFHCRHKNGKLSLDLYEIN